jgi:hypothetical protein
MKMQAIYEKKIAKTGIFASNRPAGRFRAGRTFIFPKNALSIAHFVWYTEFTELPGGFQP